MKLKIRNQNGSITMFVLISMIFFTIIVMAVYINTSYKVQAQQKEIEKIQRTYKKEDINEIYETIGTIPLVSFYVILYINKRQEIISCLFYFISKFIKSIKQNITFYLNHKEKNLSVYQKMILIKNKTISYYFQLVGSFF